MTPHSFLFKQLVEIFSKTQTCQEITVALYPRPTVNIKIQIRIIDID